MRKKELTLYYATNRKHKGKKQWEPEGYGTEFSTDENGVNLQNLRFGILTVNAEKQKIDDYLRDFTDGSKGNGTAISEYLTDTAQKADINAYTENKNQLGSITMFNELRKAMKNAADVLIYVHRYDTSWHESVGNALALQEMVNQKTADKEEKILIVLFSWPSNGRILDYHSDRRDTSNYAGSVAMGRGMLKLYDYLLNIKDQPRCQRKIHLLCHSMGNFVLQNALKIFIEDSPFRKLPTLFNYIFIAQADIDNNVFEKDKDMHRLPELAKHISIYNNKKDVVLGLADWLKHDFARLGREGLNSFDSLSNKIHQIDCTEVVDKSVDGSVWGHNYYLNGLINKDIRLSLLGFSANDEVRNRTRQGRDNHWKLSEIKKNIKKTN